MALVVVWGCIVPACSSEDDAGAAPSIADLQLSPTEIPAGDATNVNADFTFEDPDGDVEDVAIVLTVEGMAVDLMTGLVGPSGQTAGAGRVILMVQPVQAGPIEVELRVIDASGNESNVLSSEVTAVAAEDEETETGAAGPPDVWIAEASQ